MEVRVSFKLSSYNNQVSSLVADYYSIKLNQIIGFGYLHQIDFHWIVDEIVNIDGSRWYDCRQIGNFVRPYVLRQWLYVNIVYVQRNIMRFDMDWMSTVELQFVNQHVNKT